MSASMSNGFAARRSALVLGVSAALAWAVLACAAPTSSAAAKANSRDVAATRVYVQANYALVHAALANLDAGRRALLGLQKQIAAECPAVAEGSPENKQSDALGEEVIGTMVLLVYRSDAHAIAVFTRTVQGLHWSNRTLTRIVHSYAAKFERMMALAPADICSDVKSWVTSGCQTLPPSTIEFNKVYYANSIEAEEVPLHLLAPYEGPAQVSLLRRTKRLEAPLANAEALAVETWSAIIKSMGLYAM
jgi:hypothetical protein